jgi:predicted phosphatase
MAPRIHVIERLKNFKKIEGHIHESGLWDVPTQKADALVGGDIYFHIKQKEPSYFGGKILSYSIHEVDDEYRGRIIFRFEFSPDHRNVLADAGGWSYEKKIVL